MAQISAMGSARPAEGFRVGRIFGRAFGVLGRHLVLFCLVSAIPVLPELFVTGEGSAGPLDASQLGPLVWLLLLAILLTPVTQAIVLYGAFQDMRSRPFGFGEALKKGLARFFPIIGLGICEAVALIVGAILLVFPMFIFWAMFFVAVPACVVERMGPIESLKRSASLTDGHKWRIFGIVVLLALVNIIGAALISALVAAFGVTAVAVGTLIWRALVTAFSAVVTSVMYHDLRAAKEGIDIERMAAVFD